MRIKRKRKSCNLETEPARTKAKKQTIDRLPEILFGRELQDGKGRGLGFKSEEAVPRPKRGIINVSRKIPSSRILLFFIGIGLSFIFSFR